MRTIMLVFVPSSLSPAVSVAGLAIDKQGIYDEDGERIVDFVSPVASTSSGENPVEATHLVLLVKTGSMSVSL